MIEKFKTLFYVKSSLISLYLALTIPIPLIASEKFKIFSIVTFVFGLFLIINITNDYVKTSDNKISYETSFISKFFGKKNWEIFWKDIKFIVEKNTKLSLEEVSYISPLWTYKLLTYLSVFMVFGEIIAFLFKYYQY